MAMAEPIPTGIEPERPICFVVSPIGKDGSDVRVRSDLILKHIITPVAEACGFQPLRADKISESGFITTQVINHIIDDPMLIADLTGHNANVFYELAVRHASRKPYIQIIQKGEQIPFDLAGIRTIEVDHKDLESVAEAKIEMEKQIRAMALPSYRIENPISIAVDFDKLKRSDDPEKRQIADILQGIAEIKALIGAPPLRRDEARRRREREADEIVRHAIDLTDPQRAKVVDIMEALKASLAEAKRKEEDTELPEDYDDSPRDIGS